MTRTVTTDAVYETTDPKGQYRSEHFSKAEDEMIRQLMQQIVATWSEREPNAQYRFVPNDGWYPLNNESISYPRIPEEELEPYAEYCLVQENTIWRLYRDAKLNQHLLCRMVVDLETDTVVWSFWVLSSDELASLMLDFVRSRDTHL